MKQVFSVVFYATIPCCCDCNLCQMIQMANCAFCPYHAHLPYTFNCVRDIVTAVIIPIFNSVQYHYNWYLKHSNRTHLHAWKDGGLAGHRQWRWKPSGGYRPKCRQTITRGCWPERQLRNRSLSHLGQQLRTTCRCALHSERLLGSNKEELKNLCRQEMRHR